MEGTGASRSSSVGATARSTRPRTIRSDETGSWGDAPWSRAGLGLRRPTIRAPVQRGGAGAAGPSRARTASPGHGVAMVGLGMLLTITEHADPGRSECVLREALEMADRLGDRGGQVRTRTILGDHLTMRGETD